MVPAVHAKIYRRQAAIKFRAPGKSLVGAESPHRTYEALAIFSQIVTLFASTVLCMIATDV